VVVNDHILSEAIAFPARSFTPVVMVTVYNVEGANDDECVKVTVLRSELKANAPGKLVPALFFTKKFLRPLKSYSIIRHEIWFVLLLPVSHRGGIIVYQTPMC